MIAACRLLKPASAAWLSTGLAVTLLEVYCASAYSACGQYGFRPRGALDLQEMNRSLLKAASIIPCSYQPATVPQRLVTGEWIARPPKHLVTYSRHATTVHPPASPRTSGARWLGALVAPNVQVPSL